MFHPKAVHPSTKRFDRVRRKFEIEFPKAFRTYSRNHAQVFAQHRRKCKILNLSQRDFPSQPARLNCEQLHTSPLQLPPSALLLWTYYRNYTQSNYRISRLSLRVTFVLRNNKYFFFFFKLSSRRDVNHETDTTYIRNDVKSRMRSRSYVYTKIRS